jgi:hypothetical protein
MFPSPLPAAQQCPTVAQETEVQKPKSATVRLRPQVVPPSCETTVTGCNRPAVMLKFPPAATQVVLPEAVGRQETPRISRVLFSVRSVDLAHVAPPLAVEMMTPWSSPPTAMQDRAVTHEMPSSS